jgi:hypothetical protein
VEDWLAWKKVSKDLQEGLLGANFDKAERADIHAKEADAETAAEDEVWGGYRFVVFADNQKADGLKAIDLGAGHASASEALVGRIITALISQGLLNESVGAGYLDRNWPPALKESGAWPLVSLRQSFLNGALTRLLDPDAVLKTKIVEFVSKGDFGLASGQSADGTFERIWFQELISSDEVAFESGVFLLSKIKSKALKSIGKPEPGTGTTPILKPKSEREKEPDQERREEEESKAQTNTLRLKGTIPPEIWNRLGTKVIPKLKSAGNLQVGVEFSVVLDGNQAKGMQIDINNILDELGLSGKLKIDLLEE